MNVVMNSMIFHHQYQISNNYVYYPVEICFLSNSFAIYLNNMNIHRIANYRKRYTKYLSIDFSMTKFKNN